MAACARFLVRSASRAVQSSLAGSATRSLPATTLGWTPCVPAAAVLQARWASGSSAGPTINPLDQMALQPQADLEASVAPKKAVSRGNKFQAKGVFGENIYTKGFSKNLAISPRKLNDFVKVIRGMSIQDAIIQCQVSVKKAARMCEDAIVECRKKAIEDNGADPDRLKVEEMWVGKGQYLKRSRFHARGRTGVMFKYRSHLTVMLKEEPDTVVKTRIVPMLAERPLRTGSHRRPLNN
ncbi:hypothetical protein QBZ16_004072 [Prototheca wickerhamii]|uniref:Uncharacterized protein n=1 Tax=Prototheca wickerhamii TaxID=3111 RepID=A0AAD9IJB7_PROWI|nr:hypothetical protein QBZ16_004072 [Prototheca wickerhamii]